MEKPKTPTEPDLLKKVENTILRIQARNRTFLSKHKFLYSLVGATGVVLYWRGVWHTADILESWGGWWAIIFSSLGSLILGILILSFGGILVQELIGTEVIISGLKKQKRDIDKTTEELLKEEEIHTKQKELISEIDSHLHKIEKRINDLDKELDELK